MAQFESVNKGSNERMPKMQMESFVAQAAYNALSAPEQNLLRGDQERVMEFAFDTGKLMPEAIEAALRQFDIGPLPAHDRREDVRQVNAYRRFLINAYIARDAQKERGAA